MDDGRRIFGCHTCLVNLFSTCTASILDRDNSVCFCHYVATTCALYNFRPVINATLLLTEPFSIIFSTKPTKTKYFQTSDTA